MEETTTQPYKDPLEPVKDGFGFTGALVMTKDGSKVQCHICGKFFSSLGIHVFFKHGMKADEYRERFQLAVGTGLVSEVRRREQRDNMTECLAWHEKQKQERGEDYRKQIYDEQEEKGRGKRGKDTLETKNKRGKCPAQLLEMIESVTRKLGHVPSRVEFMCETGGTGLIQNIRTTFGSWSNALEKLDYAPQV